MWRPEHYAEHTGGEIAWAAVCYAAPSTVLVPSERNQHVYLDPWPWDQRWDKRTKIRPGNAPEAVRQVRIRELTKAGALIAAEIDRLSAIPEPADTLLR